VRYFSGGGERCSRFSDTSMGELFSQPACTALDLFINHPKTVP
jgi:hypothetical protein